MAKRTGPSNENLRNLIRELKKLAVKEKVNFWKRIADDLNRSTRERREVNIERINRVTKEGESIIVPGKVLSSGELDHKVDVAAFRFSENAKEKITGKTRSIPDLMKENPKGKGVRIIG